MKIGILTYCNSYNYGAYLQAYNLCSKLNTYENIEAELIDYSMRQELEIYKVRIHKNPLVTYEKYMKKIAFTKAKKDLCLSQYSVRTDDIETFRNAVYGKYDLIIAGSDQIWQVDGFRGAFNAYWLPGDYGCPKVSFAASGRTPFKNAPEEEFSSDDEQEGIMGKVSASLDDNEDNVELTPQEQAIAERFENIPQRGKEQFSPQDCQKLAKLSEEELKFAMRSMCRDIEEFIETLYNNTELEDERVTIHSMLSRLLEAL